MRILLLLLAAGPLTACAPVLVQTTPGWDARFGVDTRMVLAQQIIDPNASRNTNPVAGMDGRSASAAYERYQKSGAAQPAPSLIGDAK